MKSGFVLIIGKPNVGKSTLLNRLIGQQLAAVSPKPQTTWKVIKGIVTQKEGQIIFVDTPGVHQPTDQLGKRMMAELEEAKVDVDLIYWMVNPRIPSDAEKDMAGGLSAICKPLFVLINKADDVSKLELLPVMAAYQSLVPQAVLFPISAKKGDNVKELIKHTFDTLPEGEAFFPEDQISDQSERAVAQEIIREKIFRELGQEVPYFCAVEINEFREKSERLSVIEATIHVNKKSQKGILIGQGGQMIKAIGMEARKSMERTFGRKIFLELRVKEHPGWREDAKFLEEIQGKG